MASRGFDRRCLFSARNDGTQKKIAKITCLSLFLVLFNAGQRVANADGVALLHGGAHFAKPRSRKKRLYSSFVLSLEVLFTAVGSDVQEGKNGVP